MTDKTVAAHTMEGSRLFHKWRRMRRFSAAFGALEAGRFELAWSLGIPLLRVRVPGFSGAFVLRRQSSDLHVFEEVFVGREFDQPELKAPKLIIDGGANVGF